MEPALNGDVIENKNESNWAVGSEVIVVYVADRIILNLDHSWGW